jgi:hypothetical protein
VARALRDVARSLEAEPDLQRVVEGIVAAVVDTVPGAEQAGSRFGKTRTFGQSLRPATW